MDRLGWLSEGFRNKRELRWTGSVGLARVFVIMSACTRRRK